MNSRSTKDTCEALEPIPPDASLPELEAWLKAVRYRCERATTDRRALIRESVVHQLRSVDIVSAPAKLADEFLGESSENGSASNLEGTPVALKNPEPWDGAVVGPEILKGLRDAFAQYLALPAGASVALALWVVHCHAHEAASISPILAITSPEKRCGKTTLLELLSAVVPRPLPVSNVTAATVFRAVDKWEPTLLVDEADTFLHTGSELRGILNSGHRRSLAYVPRCVGEHHEPRTFRTWAPKAVALIGKLPDTLADRSVEIRMRRRAPEEEVKRLRLDRLEKELEPLQRKAWTWAQDHISALSCADPEMPAGLHDRERDNWRPLLAIAVAAGRPWLTRARNAVTALQEGERDDRSLRTRLLEDVRSILEEHSSEKIRSKLLVAKLCDLEEAPWAEYKGRAGVRQC